MQADLGNHAFGVVHDIVDSSEQGVRSYRVLPNQLIVSSKVRDFIHLEKGRQSISMNFVLSNNIVQLLDLGIQDSKILTMISTQFRGLSFHTLKHDAPPRDYQLF